MEINKRKEAAMADDPGKTPTRSELIADALGKKALDYFLPKLDEQRRSAIESRKAALAAREHAEQLQHELDAVTPDTILDKMVDGWDKELAEWDKKFNDEEGK